MVFEFGELPTRLSADVVVVGGGPAGMCAAVAAAREGASVILVEQSGCCGGMATNGLVGPFMTCYDRKGETMIIRGLFEEFVNRMVARGYALHPSEVRAGTAYTSWIEKGHDHVTPFESEGMKLIADEMLEEAGVKVLYHTAFLQPILDGKSITGVIVSSKRGMEVIRGKVIIDCTGDGDVAAGSGVPYEMGNAEQGIMQPATMFFRIGGVDAEKVEKEIQEHRHEFYRKNGVNYRSFHWLVSKARENGDWTLDRVSVGLYRMPKPDEWCVNTSRLMGVDSTDNESLTWAEIQGRKQVEEIFQFIKKYIPGCENARMLSSGSYVGIRESRHIQGDYRITAEDLLECKVPEDSVLLAANSVDVHGRFGPTSNEYVVISGDYYGVPYRAMLPAGVEQMLLAGRCISADSTAGGAVRVMPPCMAMGQAVGTAAAMAVKNGCTVRQIDVQALRNRLKENGAYL